MFERVERYPFLKPMIDNAGEIGQEFARAAGRDDVFRHMISEEKSMDRISDIWAQDNGINIDAVGYDLRDGGYSMLALRTADETNTQFNMAGMFPITLSLLESIPGLHYACFSALKPNAHLERHTHARRHHIFHLLTNDLEDGFCEIICGNESRRLKQIGDHLLFDYSQPHETFNRTPSTRVNLMIDFEAGV